MLSKRSLTKKKWNISVRTSESWRSREYIEAHSAEEAREIAYQMIHRPNSTIDDDFEEVGDWQIDEDTITVSPVGEMEQAMLVMETREALRLDEIRRKRELLRLN